jgi:hypothetical protein
LALDEPYEEEKDENDDEERVSKQEQGMPRT